MTQRTVLITGAAGGIGYAAAAAFKAAGWAVCGVDRQPDPQLPAMQQYLTVDVADPAQVKFAVEQVQHLWGPLDALVNNAAVQICKPVVDMTVADWDLTLNVNLRAAFLFSQAAHPLLKAAQGSIVNVSSVHAVATSANIAAYAASKGGLSAFTRALAIELAADQIRVNAVLPGAVDTAMLRDGLSRGHLAGSDVSAMLQQLGQKTVMGRVGQPAEIAQAIVFLADGQQSGFITGHNLVIDGGATIRLSTE